MYIKKILLVLVFMTVSFVANSAVIPLDFGTLGPGDHAEVTSPPIPEDFHTVELDFVISGTPVGGANTVGGTFTFGGPNGRVVIGGARLFDVSNNVEIINAVGFQTTLFGFASASFFDLNLVDSAYQIVLEIEALDGNNATIQGQIDVAAVPIPAAIWLFGTAMIGVFGYKKQAI